LIDYLFLTFLLYCSFVVQALPRELPGQVSKGWRASAAGSEDALDNRLNCRDVLFTGCEVILAGDYTVDELTRYEQLQLVVGMCGLILAGDCAVNELAKYEHTKSVIRICGMIFRDCPQVMELSSVCLFAFHSHTSASAGPGSAPWWWRCMTGRPSQILLSSL
jgi:hypothetical protein